MSDLKQPPSPRAALNIILNGHGATCGGYALSCKKCDREHEAVLVLRALVEASEVVPAEPEQAGKAQEIRELQRKAWEDGAVTALRQALRQGPMPDLRNPYEGGE